MFWWRCARSPLSAATIARVHTGSIGGMGPSIAGTILAALGIGRILVPRDPGTFSAHGTLMTDPHQERSLTRITPVDWDDGTLDLNGGGHAINSRRQAGERIRRFTGLASLGQIRPLRNKSAPLCVRFRGEPRIRWPAGPLGIDAFSTNKVHARRQPTMLGRAWED
jgi:hypothetical protein